MARFLAIFNSPAFAYPKQFGAPMLLQKRVTCEALQT